MIARLSHPAVFAVVTMCVLSPAAHARDIPVNTPDDVAAADGTCSLREAISSANENLPSEFAQGGCPAGDDNNDTVVLPAGTYPIALGGADDVNSAGDFDIDHDVAIRGAGAGQTIIDGGDQHRVFHVLGTSPSVSLAGVSITRGAATGASLDGHAGGIYFDATSGNLSLAGTTLSGNRASDRAGAIEFRSDGTLSVSNSTFTGNAAGDAGNSGDGGAIYVGNGSVNVTSSTFSGNKVMRAGSGAAIEAFPEHGRSVNVESSTFSGNETVPLAPTQNGSGGALRLEGQGNATITVRDSNFTQNRSGGDGGEGGALTAGVETGRLSVERSSFSGNVAGGDDGYGGAIRAIGNANFTQGHIAIVDSLLSGNRAGGGGSTSYGGALYLETAGGTDIAGTTFTSNSAGDGNGAGYGGAVYSTVRNGQASFTNVTLSNNTAGATSAESGSGGGVYNEADPYPPGSPASATLTNVTLHGNSVLGPSGSGGNLEATAATVKNTIVSGGSAASGANCSGAAASGGHNLVSGPSCGFTAPGDQVADPRLGPLQDNGGPTPTHALLPGSPAIDAADGGGAPGTDQRGVSRPQRAGFDIGAFERRPLEVSGSASPNPAERATPVAFSAQAGPDPADGVTYSWAFDDGGSASGPDVTHAFETVGVHTGTVTVTDPGGASASAAVAVTVVDTIAVAIQSFSARRRFALGPGLTPVTTSRRRRTPRGTVFRYSLSEPARVRIAIERARPGRRAGRRCVKPTARNRRRRRCTRYQRVLTLTRSGTAGRNSLRFSGRWRVRSGRRALRPGRYRASITATDAGGNTSQPRRLALRVVRR